MNLPSIEEDQRVIKAVQNGEQIAFAELYDKHSAWLMALAFRILGNNRDAEDLLHDFFLEVWHKADSYDANKGSLKSWLAIKLRSRALDRLRSLRTIRKYCTEQDSIPASQTPPTLDDADFNHDHWIARELMQHLSPMQRTVIELSYFRGYTCQEIANHCHLPLGTVKSGIQRGIQAMRKHLSNSEAVHS